MQEFMKDPSPRRFSRRTTAVLALAGVLLAAGAATGTVALVRSWFVTVQIGDQQYQLQTDDNGQGSLTVQTDDGRTANIHVQRVEGEEGNDRTNVEVNVNGPNSQEQKVIKMERRSGGAPGGDATVADLAGTDPVASWGNPDGATKAVHFVPQSNGGVRLFMVTTLSNGTQSIRRLAELPSQLNLAGQTPQVSHTADGMVTLTFDADGGHKRVLKFVDRQRSGDAPPADGPVQVDTGNATIRINANPPGDDE